MPLNYLHNFLLTVTSWAKGRPSQINIITNVVAVSSVGIKRGDSSCSIKHVGNPIYVWTFVAVWRLFTGKVHYFLDL